MSQAAHDLAVLVTNGIDHELSSVAAISLGGGALIGLGASMLLLFNGRLAGIGGIVAGLFQGRPGERRWRTAFVGGLLAGGVLLGWWRPSELTSSAAPAPLLLLAGATVGFGARLGGGCTSGHGVCGVSRVSKRSTVATMTFMLVGAAVVALARVLGARGPQ
jgi:hypothetical protein